MLPSTSAVRVIYPSYAAGQRGREFTRTVNSYRPSVSTMVEGDYWLYTLPVKATRSRYGRRVRRHDGRQANSPKYFIVKYLDGGVWKSVEEDLLTAPEDPSIRYSYSARACHRNQLPARQHHADHPFHRSRRGCGADQLPRCGSLHLQGWYTRHFG